MQRQEALTEGFELGPSVVRPEAGLRVEEEPWRLMELFRAEHRGWERWGGGRGE